MKRQQHYTIVLAATLLVGVAACGKEPSTTSADSNGKSSAAEVEVAEKTTPAATTTPNPELEPERKTTIPAGAKLRTILIDALSSDKSHSGDRFLATLAEPVVVEGRTVLAKGTKVRGRVIEATGSGRVKGRACVELTLTEIVLNNGKNIEISTRTYSAVAPATKKRDAAIIGGGAGLGAVIGALAGGGKGAAIGAAVGGGAGTGTVLATKGKEIRYAPETRLQFTLTSPIEI